MTFPLKVSGPILKLFTQTDKVLINQDKLYWLTQLDTYLQLYRNTSVESEAGKEAKAYACAKLAGFALAMAEHFGRGVASLHVLDSPEMSDAGAKAYGLHCRHTDRLEAAAVAKMS